MKEIHNCLDCDHCFPGIEDVRFGTKKYFKLYNVALEAGDCDDDIDNPFLTGEYFCNIRNEIVGVNFVTGETECYHFMPIC